VPVYMTADDLGQPVALSFRATADNGRLALDVQRLEALWGKPPGGTLWGARSMRGL